MWRERESTEVGGVAVGRVRVKESRFEEQGRSVDEEADTWREASDSERKRRLIAARPWSFQLEFGRKQGLRASRYNESSTPVVLSFQRPQSTLH